MKVILVNGSPKKDGCTVRALKEVQTELTAQNIQTEIFNIGRAVAGCTACGGCVKNKNNRCVIDGDSVNEFLAKAAYADGFIFGSPVHFAGISGNMKSFMDRSFYVGRHTIFPLKPASAIVSCRRAGSSAALDSLNKYLTISQMIFITSNYWNMVHGSTPADVEQDGEGLQIMRTLGKNTAYMLRVLSESKIPKPETEKKIWTNFIR